MQQWRSGSKDYCRAIGSGRRDVIPDASSLKTWSDSLDNGRARHAFEDAFDIVYPCDQAEKILTVQDAVDFIKENS